MKSEKKNRILLIYPPLTKKYAPNPMDIPVPHIGIAYIGSVLLEGGYEVAIKDCPSEEINIEELFKFLNNNKFDIVGISTYYFNNNNVIRIINKLRMEGVFLFVGGMLPTLSSKSVLKAMRNVGCCVVGEGEKTVLELVEAIENNSDWHSIDGIAYLDDNKDYVFTQKRKLVDNLDELPFPIRISPKRELYTPILASRGCYGNCNFCSIESYYKMCDGKKVRIRNPINVVDEIETLVKSGHRYIKFNDENFNISSTMGKKWFEIFYSEIKKRNINAKYTMDMRVNEIIYGKEEMRKFIKIGLDFIFIGVESFLQNHLDFFNKHVKVEDNLLAMNILDELEVNYRIGLLLFNPITTIEDIKQSLDIIEKVYYVREDNMMKPISLFQPVVAVAGTPIYDYVVEHGIHKNNGRGYVFADEQVEQYYGIVKKWSKYINNIYENRFLVNEEKIPKKLFHALYKLDLHFMQELLEKLKTKKNSEEDYASLIEKNKLELDKLWEKG